MHIRVFAIVTTLVMSSAYGAPQDDELSRLRDEVRQLRQAKEAFEARIGQLEQRLSATENKSAPAVAVAPAAAGTASIASSNPALSLILSGTYADLKRDPASYQIGGFIPGGDELGPGKRGFSLGESELVLSANIDPYFYGKFTAALTGENEVEVEEAYVESLALANGVGVRAGRFFSGIGYLNGQHAHVWDFVDAPLAYQAFLGGRLKEDGLALRWLAPTELYVELGAEALRGAGFPGSERDRNGFGTQTLFAHIGGDVGVSHSWRAGLSMLKARPQNREYDDLDSLGRSVKNGFSGRSRTLVADAVWKWAPEGNAKKTNFKLQGEYFRRREQGTLEYDRENSAAGTASDSYAARQSGFYLQGIYQFMPRWRAGLRYDELDSGSSMIGLVENGVLGAADFPLLEQHKPRRKTFMVDYSPSEFSRVRLQFARDHARPGAADSQVFLQYIMSLGAHGAHQF